MTAQFPAYQCPRFRIVFRLTEIGRIARKIFTISGIILCHQAAVFLFCIRQIRLRRRILGLRRIISCHILIVLFHFFRIGIFLEICVSRQPFPLGLRIENHFGHFQIMRGFILQIGFFHRRFRKSINRFFFRFNGRKRSKLGINLCDFAVHLCFGPCNIVIRHHDFRIGKLGSAAVRHPDKTFLRHRFVRHRIRRRRCFIISETRFDHFFFEEFELRLICRFRTLIAAVIGNKTFELVVARKEIVVDGFRFAVCIRNITVA